MNGAAVGLICDTKWRDHESAKQALARDIYRPYIARIAAEQEFSCVNLGANIRTFDFVIFDKFQRIGVAVSV